MNSCFGEINFFIKDTTLIYCLTSLSFLVVWLLIWVQSSYSVFDRRRIPKGAIPKYPFGNIKDVILKTCPLFLHLWKFYNRFKRKKSFFGGVYLLSRPSVIFMDPHLIHKVLTEHRYFKNSAKTSYTKNILKIFSNKVLDVFLKKYETIDELFAKDLKEEDVNLDNILFNYFLNTSSVLLGLQENKDKICLIAKDMEKHNKSNIMHYIALNFPKLFNLFRYKSDTKNISILEDLIKDEIIKRKKNDIEKVDLLHESIPLKELEIKELASNFLVFLNDSVEFSQVVTQFCLYEICKNLEIQEELIGEIRRYLKEKEEESEDGLSNILELTFLDAVVKETLRKYPPCSTITKICIDEFKNERYNLDLPKNCLAIVSIYGIHHDPVNFINPEHFDPDRFCIENKKFVKPYTFIPFGIDEKQTIGMKFIVFQVKMCLISILSKYSLSFRNKDSSQITFDSDKLQIALKVPLNLKFKKLSLDV